VQSSQLNANGSRPQRGSFATNDSATSDEDDIPALAAQALAGVAEKLSSALSVEYKVNELIGQAIDPQRLAVIFHGWQPVRFRFLLSSGVALTRRAVHLGAGRDASSA
jgi:hypothetical protein